MKIRRKYSDCQQPGGNCGECSLIKNGRDCHNRPITALELARRKAGLTQKQLAEAVGINITQIQRIELGEAQAGNVTAKNLLAIADTLRIDIRSLCEK